MATADQVKALIRSHAEGDDARFYAVAMQVAAQAARSGHGRFAQELRELVDRAKAVAAEPPRSPRGRAIPVVQPRGELGAFLSASYPRTQLSDMVLEATIRLQLDRVVLEHRRREALLSHGLSPIRKLLLLGPPGTGKTMSASALASEISLPLFSIQLDGLITKFMGETAAKLRLVFEAMHDTRGVYLFDEFDALGSDRASRNDVGEIRRVLNSFLVMLEQDESESVIVAASNHPALLDRALFRRFDAIVEYVLPSRDATETLLRARLAFLETAGLDWTLAATEAEGLSHAEIARACEQAAKNAILSETTHVDTVGLVAAVRERRAARRE